jgi:hypothetical protein
VTCLLLQTRPKERTADLKRICDNVDHYGIEAGASAHTVDQSHRPAFLPLPLKLMACVTPASECTILRG